MEGGPSDFQDVCQGLHRDGFWLLVVPVFESEGVALKLSCGKCCLQSVFLRADIADTNLCGRKEHLAELDEVGDRFRDAS